MNETMFERLAGLKPQLAAHVRLFPQTCRGETWFVLANEAHGRYLRLNAAAYAVVGRLDGTITLRDLADALAVGGNGVSEAELSAIVLRLADVGALRAPLPEDVGALTGAGRRDRLPINPLALKFPLVDPDGFLDATMHVVRPLFTRTAALLGLTVGLVAALLGVLHADTIGAAVGRHLLAPKNLIVAWLVFTALKILHEFAHAYAVKRWGGEVHEMGVSLLVLMPVPYVEASSSWTFRSKYHRALVGAAGIIVEGFSAALALLIFLAVEPGLVRDIALNTMLIGGLSTLLVNGNPLLRFDGYHVLQDLAELPNLSTRASAYLRYLVKRYILRLHESRSPVTAGGERRWLATYGIAAGLYRIFILAAIGLFLAGEYLAIGVALVSWAVLMQIVLPAGKAIAFLATDPALRGHRLVSTARVALVPALLVTGLALVPVGYTTSSQGIVWLPEQAQVYARSDGFVARTPVEDGAQVVPGITLFELVNDELVLERRALEARAREIEATRVAEQFGDRTAADVAAAELGAVHAGIGRLDEQLSALTVVSRASGSFVRAMPGDLAGRFVRQGELLGYIVDPHDLIVRAVVPERDIGRLRNGVTAVEVRLAERTGDLLEARVLRETPAGSAILPSRALAEAGGGDIATEPTDGDALRTTTNVFNLDLALPAGTRVAGIGGRAYLQYRHRPAPLLAQWHDRLRQLLLSRLGV